MKRQAGFALKEMSRFFIFSGKLQAEHLNAYFSSFPKMKFHLKVFIFNEHMNDAFLYTVKLEIGAEKSIF